MKLPPVTKEQFKEKVQRLYTRLLATSQASDSIRDCQLYDTQLNDLLEVRCEAQQAVIRANRKIIAYLTSRGL